MTDYNDPVPERGDQCTAGLNFIPLRPRRDIQEDYKKVLEAIYSPEAFYDRLTRVSAALRNPDLGLPNLRVLVKDIAFFARLSLWLIINRPPGNRRFWRLFFSCALNNPTALECVVMMTSFYLHVGPFAKHVICDLEHQIGSIDCGEYVGNVQSN